MCMILMKVFNFCKLHLQITSNFTVTVIMLQYTSGRRKRKTGNVRVTQH